jgi:tetratricopeptide (TPR) repeat protein
VTLVVVAALFATPRANAQSVGSDEERLEVAKAAYARGAAAYEQGHYLEAIEQFERAQKINPSPALLFNLARAESKAGREEAALAHMRQYLAARQDEPEAPTVRAQIEALEHAIAERRERADIERQVEDAGERSQRANRLASIRRRKRMRVAAWTLFAVGLTAAASGVAAGLVAEHDSQSVERAGASAPGLTAVPFNQVAGTASGGLAAQRAGLVLDVAGGALAAAGLGLIAFSYRPAARALDRAWIAPGPRAIVMGIAF